MRQVKFQHFTACNNLNISTPICRDIETYMMHLAKKETTPKYHVLVFYKIAHIPILHQTRYISVNVKFIVLISYNVN